MSGSTGGCNLEALPELLKSAMAAAAAEQRCSIVPFLFVLRGLGREKQRLEPGVKSCAQRVGFRRERGKSWRM